VGGGGDDGERGHAHTTCTGTGCAAHLCRSAVV
jgi:hypothetical protein